MTIRRSLLAALLAATAWGQDGPVCSNETIQGAYGFTVTGTVPAGTVLPQFFQPPGTMEQIVGVVIAVFDGKGNFTQVDNVKGTLSGIVLDRPGRGTYSVNANCTGTYSIIRPDPLPPIVTRFVIVDGGKELRVIVVSPLANLTLANGRKM
jgi:hypothetical protein